ncbi:MAG: diguanylate cyclase, partial [Gammaproteobacteria bacterium]
GEEFALILPDTTLEQGVRFADRLRKAIGNTTIKIGELKVKVKASFGVDVYENGDEVSEKGFVEQVDGYLYNAKQQGRDRVCNREFIPAFMKTSDKAG